MGDKQRSARPGASDRFGWALLLRLAIILCVALPPLVLQPQDLSAAAPHGAGLVIRHGDGRVIYAYVEFSEPEISGVELLERSHLPAVLTPSGSLGAAVCSLDGEGCPAENCFCKSYGNPAFFWQYDTLDPSGQWVTQSVGPSSRMVHDGDVDGWSWTDGESRLPATTINEIAKLNGVNRAGSAASPPSNAEPTTPASAIAESGNENSGTAAANAHAVEVQGTSSPKPVLLSDQTNDSGMSPWSYAGYAAILVVLAAILAWILLRRRRAGP